jgi:hypothetical protein
MLNKIIVVLLFILTLMIIIYMSPKLIECIENNF